MKEKNQIKKKKKKKSHFPKSFLFPFTFGFEMNSGMMCGKYTQVQEDYYIH